MRKRVYPIIVAFILSSLMFGCSTHRPTISISGDLVSDMITRREIVELIREKSRQITAFKTLARATIDRKGEKSTVRYLMVLEAPNKIHFEVLPVSSGYAFGVFKSDGVTAVYLDTAPKVAYLGEANSETLKKFLSIPLAPDTILSLLLGRVPGSLMKADGSTMRIFSDRSKGSFFLSSAGNRELYEIEGNSFLLRRFSLSDIFKETIQIEISYSDIRVSEDGISYPGTVTFSVPDQDLNVTLKFGSITLNKPSAESLFDTTIPFGYNEEDVR